MYPEDFQDQQVKSKQDKRNLDKEMATHMQFMQSDSANIFDKFMEQNLDKYIEQGIEQGLDDATLIQNFGGGAPEAGDMRQEIDNELFE